MRRLVAAGVLLALSGLPVALSSTEGGPAGDRVIVIDPGHGGADHGARGRGGVLEKSVVLSVSRRLGEQLVARGFDVVYTRSDDDFVPLPERTDIANRARGALFLSIHANSAPSSRIRGTETYFLSLEASDDEARRVAMTENEVFGHRDAVADSGDVVGAILGDLIRTDHLRASGAVAGAIQRKLGALDKRGRGVKQAPFVVLMGVNMPAVLIEIGFLTHPAEARALTRKAHQRALAAAVADAVAGWFDSSASREARSPAAAEGSE